MAMDSDFIWRLLPNKLKKCCLIGVCNPKYLDGLKPVYSIKNKKWSAAPREIFPKVKSIIVLLHFIPIANDYSIEKIILELGSLLLKKLKFKTHIIGKAGKIDPDSLVGTEWGESSQRYKKLILLKELAYYAGLGQWGKNSLIINPHFGSDFKIQALFSEEKIRYDSPLLPKKYPGCEDCNQCIELCPGGALNNYKIDPLKCPMWEGSRISPKSLKFPPFCLISLRKPKGNYVIDHMCCRNCQAFCKANKSHYYKRR